MTEYCAVIGTHSTVRGDKLLYGQIPDPFPRYGIGSGHARLGLQLRKAVDVAMHWQPVSVEHLLWKLDYPVQSLIITMPVLYSCVARLDTTCVALECAGFHNELRALLLQVGLSD